MRAPRQGAFGLLDPSFPAPGLVVLQPRRGYRFGVEVYALAGFALAGGDLRPASAIDLGAGSGVVGLLLASRGLAVTAVERDRAWCALARLNARLSASTLEVRWTAVRRGGAVSHVPAADLVVCNPPWFLASAGPASPDRRRAAARTMLGATVADFVDAALSLAPRVCVVTRVEREQMLDRPGAHVARRATLGRRVIVAEVRRGPGSCRQETLDLPAIYASFGREFSPAGRGG